jgi:dTDP-4-dehydrorhamnose reductase
MLGTDLSAALRATGREVRVLDLPECDVTRSEHLERALVGAEAVVNCAAYTQVDTAETNRAVADAVNHVAVGALGRLAAARGVYVLHISTDFVFDGTLDRPYQETDVARPLSVYGATKLAGEEALAASGCGQAVVRVQWTYGSAGQHFSGKIRTRARAGGGLSVVADQVGSPTWTRDVAAALVELLGQRAEGLFHYAAAGYASRYEVAAAALELSGLTGTRLTACCTGDFPAAAPRPLNSRFDCSRIDERLSAPRPHWREALGRFLAEWVGGRGDTGA